MFRTSTRAGRISNREMRRRAQQAIEHGTKVHLILLAVLAQSGGEVTVTDGTLQQVGRNLADLDYVIADGKVKGESIVRLVEGKNHDADVQAPSDVQSDAAPAVRVSDVSADVAGVASPDPAAGEGTTGGTGDGQ